ncbi:EmrB/QacA subfamily drug resistance transporter [Rhodococcus sp. 27YEA15]|uniref:MFS transporter n=1 Tax=Rhodococcus sp. 27YEA15 TaxID=3156259 RepID=UPI003C7C6FA5
MTAGAMIIARIGNSRKSSSLRKWIPLLAISLGTFMLLIDVTIVVVALADIQQDLGSNFSQLQWIVEVYALVLAALIVATGSIADRVGHRNVYIAGTALFAASSLACGLSPNTWMLIASRGIQGLAAAAMFATTVSLLQATYTGRDRGPAFAVWGAVSGASAGLGVVLGGVLTQMVGWRWIFFVNLPVSLVAIALSAVAFTNVKFGRSRIDVLGVVTLSVAAGAVTFGIINGGEHGWTTPTTVAAFATSIAGLVAFLLTESRVQAPMIPLRLFKVRMFTGSLVGAAGQSFAAFGISPLVSLWAQDLLELSPVQTGLVMLPLSAVAFVVSASMGRLLDRLPPALTIGGSLTLIGVGTLSLLLIGPDSTWTASLPGMILIGIGVGVGTPPLMATALTTVEPHYLGVAAGVVNMSRQLGYALGIAIFGSVFAGAAGSSRPGDSVDYVNGLNAAWIVAGTGGIVLGLVTIAVLRVNRGSRPTGDPATSEPVPAVHV